MKKLIIPVFGLLLAACTYQFAPTAPDDTRRPDYNTGATTAAVGNIGLPAPPATDGGFGPGAPGGMGASPGTPDPGADGGMPSFPDVPSGGTMPGG